MYSFNEYKTITCGDGGMIVTDDEDLYGRLFAIHDQGHAPNRLSSKYAERPFLGMNFRMTELSGAVLLAQVRKLDMIRSHLRANKKIVKSAIEDLPGLGFRAIVDPEGDLATHLVVTFPSAEVAQAVAGELGSITLDGVRLARLLEHGAPAREADCQREGLPVRLLVLRPRQGRLPAPACCRRPTRCSPAR